MAMLVAAAWLALLGPAIVVGRAPTRFQCGVSSFDRPSTGRLPQLDERSARVMAATAAVYASWWPARYSATGWRPFAFGAVLASATHTGSQADVLIFGAAQA